MSFGSSEIKLKQSQAKELLKHLANSYVRQKKPLPTKSEIKEQMGVVKKVSLSRSSPRSTVEEEIKKLEDQLHVVVSTNYKLLDIQKKDEESLNLLKDETISLREELEKTQSRFEKEIQEKNKKINDLLESLFRQLSVKNPTAIREKDRKCLADVMDQRIAELEQKHSEFEAKGLDKSHLERLKRKINDAKKQLKRIKG